VACFRVDMADTRVRSLGSKTGEAVDEIKDLAYGLPVRPEELLHRVVLLLGLGHKW
jgi:hypothetical protein